MQTDEFISVREYLSTSYDSDCDYVHGGVEGRNVGETDHSILQGALAGYFYERRKKWHAWAPPEQRVQVSPTGFRVPDICVVVGAKPTNPIVRTPRFIVMEIPSSDDRMSQVRAKLNDFLNFGIPNIWLLDPKTCQAYRRTSAGLTEVFELRTENSDMLVPLEALLE
jgi:Uma2 family endonuclease